MGHYNLDPHMQNLPYGDTHTHTGIPVRIQEEAAKNCEKFLYGDPHMHTVVDTMWTPTKKKRSLGIHYFG